MEVEIVMKNFVAAACFVSLERACARRAGEARNNNETTDRWKRDDEKEDDE